MVTGNYYEVIRPLDREIYSQDSLPQLQEPDWQHPAEVLDDRYSLAVGTVLLYLGLVALEPEAPASANLFQIVMTPEQPTGSSTASDVRGCYTLCSSETMRTALKQVSG